MTIPRFTARVDARPIDTPWPRMPWPPPSDVRLRGRFVELSQADPDRDADELFAALDHDAVWQHVAGRPSDAAGYAKLLRDGYAAGRLPWIVRLASENGASENGASENGASENGAAENRADNGASENGAVVGMSSYLDVSASDARLEIGFTAYTPAVWAGVVNPETKLLLLGYAFDTLGAGRVQLKTDVRNVRSQQAIARLGAQFEGVFRRYQRRSDDTMRDTVFFSILAEEWPGVRAALIARLDGTHTVGV